MPLWDRPRGALL